MTVEPCDEQFLISFLSGELGDADAAKVDAHLLGCDACWAATVEDRFGHQAAASLREPASPAVRERLRGALDAAELGRRRRRRRPLAAAMVVLALVGLVTAITSNRSRRPTDASSLAAVVRLAGSGEPPPAGAGIVQVWRSSSASGEVTIAESPRPFPMPPDARFSTVGASQVWVARRGRLVLLCVMAPHAALLAGAVPEAELASVARAYGLAG